MRIALTTALVAFALGAAAPARAEEPPPGAPERSRIAVTPFAGFAAGTWMRVPVTRGMVGVAIVPPTSSDVACEAVALFEPGRTENGLGAHRAEVGVGLSLRPRTFRLALGVHLAYAMLVRATESDAFAKALFGDIGGFAIGTHADMDVAIPLGGGAALTLGVRGAVDAYDGGLGAEGGPTIGVRF